MKHFSLTQCALALCLAANLSGIGVAWGMANAEVPLRPTTEAPQAEKTTTVTLQSARQPIWYEVYSRTDGSNQDFLNFVHFEGLADDNAVRIQLDDPTNPNGIQLGWKTGSSSSTNRTITDGGVWATKDDCSIVIDNILPNYPGLYLQIITNKTCEVGYTITAYAKQDTTSEKLASSHHTLKVITKEQQPTLSSQPEIITGDLNSDISFPVTVENAGLLTGKKATLTLFFELESGSIKDLTISGHGIAIDENGNYSLTVESLAATTYNLTAKATANCVGTYCYALYDPDGINLFQTTSGDVAIPFSINDGDLKLLTAIKEVNPANNELKDFIDQEKYKLPTSEQGSIRVSWTPTGYVKTLYIADWQGTITSLPLQGLDKLEELEIQGTGLSQLDLTNLPSLKKVTIYNSRLTWNDFTLPDSLNFEMKGNTKMDKGTLLAGGTVVDLSEYATFKGQASQFIWCKHSENSMSSTNEVVQEENQPGKFILPNNEGAKYSCMIYNRTYFSEFHMETEPITIGLPSSFSATDIAGLQKLAADNQVAALTEYVESNAWENDKWNNSNPIRTQWADVNGTKRLTHLKIEFDWGAKDTIKAMDLSAFTELKYLECERYMDLSSIDLSKNTKLEFLHLFSYNFESLDLTPFTQLTNVCIGSRMTGEWAPSAYKKSKLQSVNLSGLTKLTDLQIEHAHMSTLDLSSNSALRYLVLEDCQDLVTINGFDKLTQLSYLSLPYTEKLQGVMNQLPSTLTQLGLIDTEYPLPSESIASNLIYLGIPKQIDSFDLSKYPKLANLDMGYQEESPMTYSKLQGYREGVSFNGQTTYNLYSASGTTSFIVGSVIDLSSEATINNVPSTFVWLNRFGNIVDDGTIFQPIEGEPGKFVITEKASLNALYQCRILNPLFGTLKNNNTDIDGWKVVTSDFFLSVPVYAKQDVQALASIVNNSKNQGLIDWFNDEGWKQNGYTDLDAYGGVQVEWSDEPTKRLTSLSLSFMFEWLTGTVDVSDLDRLEYLELPFTNVSGVKLPSNPEKLAWLELTGTKVKSLDLTTYTQLTFLSLQSTGMEHCDLSKNTKLKVLRLGGTTIALDTTTLYPNLTEFMTADNATSLDMKQMPKLKTLMVMNDQLKFSDVKNAHQLDTVIGDSYLMTSKVVYKDVSMVAKEAVLDFSKEIATGAVLLDKDSLISVGTNQYKVDWTKAKLICIDLTNEKFPGWTLHYPMSMLTDKGDVNYDEQVNVQDVTATAARLAEVPENMLWDYSIYAGDVNENEEIDAGDLVGIVNIIMDKPFTKSSELRAAYLPTVDVQMDEKNFLTMENEVPVAALYLEIAGANAETALLADAARLMQASSLKGDTLRIVAYSLDGRTIASGKHILAQLQPGMHVVKATFSDAQAALLQTTGDLLSTANETIVPEVEAKAIYNYPNPAAGQTTFCYQLAQPAQSVEIQFFASNGAFVARLQGLPTEAGSQSYSTTLPLGAGVYYYRLVIDGKQVTATNTLIIK